MREMDHRLDDYFVQHKDIVIRNICLYVDYHTAEDLCQETFIRLQKYLDRVKPAKIVSWLIVVSEHLAMDHLKKGGQYTTVPGLNMADAELLEFCSDPAEIVLEREDSRKRLRVLERLRRERWAIPGRPVEKTGAGLAERDVQRRGNRRRTISIAAVCGLFYIVLI